MHTQECIYPSRQQEKQFVLTVALNIFCKNRKTDEEGIINLTRILIIGPAWVGDMIMAQSLFIALKQNNPTCTIDVLAPEWTRPLLERMPQVNNALSLSMQHGEFALIKRICLANNLKTKKYDQAIVLPNSWKSAFIPWWAKIPKRSGWMGEFRVGLLNDIRILNKTLLPKMVQRFVMLAYPKGHPAIESIPNPKLNIDNDSCQKTLDKFNLKESVQPILALCPGAEFGPSKRWPEEYYAEIANTKLKQGWQVWLFGSKNDMPSCQKIQELCSNQCINLSGKTNLGEAIDLLNKASCVITNDSGLMHIAAALEKPLIAIYGSTDPTFTPPLISNARIVRLGLACSPCFKRSCPLKHQDCMQKLMPAQILEHLTHLELQCGF